MLWVGGCAPPAVDTRATATDARKADSLADTLTDELMAEAYVSAAEIFLRVPPWDYATSGSTFEGLAPGAYSAREFLQWPDPSGWLPVCDGELCGPAEEMLAMLADAWRQGDLSGLGCESADSCWFFVLPRESRDGQTHTIAPILAILGAIAEKAAVLCARFHSICAGLIIKLADLARRSIEHLRSLLARLRNIPTDAQNAIRRWVDLAYGVWKQAEELSDEKEAARQLLDTLGHMHGIERSCGDKGFQEQCAQPMKRFLWRTFERAGVPSGYGRTYPDTLVWAHQYNVLVAQRLKELRQADIGTDEYDAHLARLFDSMEQVVIPEPSAPILDRWVQHHGGPVPTRRNPLRLALPFLWEAATEAADRGGRFNVNRAAFQVVGTEKTPSGTRLYINDNSGPLMRRDMSDSSDGVPVLSVDVLDRPVRTHLEKMVEIRSDTRDWEPASSGPVLTPATLLVVKNAGVHDLQLVGGPRHDLFLSGHIFRRRTVIKMLESSGDPSAEPIIVPSGWTLATAIPDHADQADRTVVLSGPVLSDWTLARLLLDISHGPAESNSLAAALNIASMDLTRNLLTRHRVDRDALRAIARRMRRGTLHPDNLEPEDLRWLDERVDMPSLRRYIRDTYFGEVRPMGTITLRHVDDFVKRRRHVVRTVGYAADKMPGAVWLGLAAASGTWLGRNYPEQVMALGDLFWEFVDRMPK